LNAGRKRLRVAFLTSARAWRGSGVSLSNIADGLRDRGHEPQMFAGEEAVVSRFAQRGLPAAHVPTANTGLVGARALAKALRTFQAECLVVDRPRDLRLGLLASVVYPVVLINRYNLSRPSPPRDLLSRLAYRRVRLTIFISQTNARQALEHARYLRRQPHRVIPEGIGTQFRPDPAAVSVFREWSGLGNREFVLAVGSLTADKRYEFLFEAMNSIGPDAPLLVVCGDGPLAAHLRERAHALATDVCFLGLVPPDLLVGAYGAAACFVHVCEIETFGLSVLEAMACGRPVLAVRGGAVPEVLGDAGVLAAPGDQAEFGRLLRALLTDPVRRSTLGAAARHRAKEQFSLERMQQSYTEAIEIACGVTEPARVEHAGPASRHV
jgi:glycosyltransferase involved in cell wall biosynthesis